MLFRTYSNKDQDQPGFERVGVEREKGCFYCGQDLDRDFAVEWLGHKAEIFFHAGCVSKFTLRLINDVYAYQRATRRSVT